MAFAERGASREEEAGPGRRDQLQKVVFSVGGHGGRGLQLPTGSGRDWGAPRRGHGRVPEVFEEKTSWKVDGTDEDLHEILAENYQSAEENSQDIQRQVLEEVRSGTIVKMTLQEARSRFGERLAVAALGAVPKELGSTKVRMIYDGTYSVDVNRRIRVRDRLRFPLLDDASAVLGNLEEETEEAGGGVRFSMVYDVSKAHRLIPIRPEDWGLQSFRMPGEEGDSVYCHTRGTFGVASAAYWWGRCAASVVRFNHRVADRALAIMHLLYADDGWMVATGSWFWRKLLFWFFCMELWELPITWKKVAGGVESSWIGYQLDVGKYLRGIGPKKQKWVLEWIDSKLAEGGITGRPQIGPGEAISFVAGALRHVRPFLAPLFSWASTLAPGTYCKFPDAVQILLRYVQAEVRRSPMRKASRERTGDTDCFRIDAKADGDEITIGGWDSHGGRPTGEARWFSFRLNRKLAPWAYLRGDPFRSIASLELVGVLVAVMALGPGSDWGLGSGLVTVTAYTDNQSNTHVLRRFSASKYPLSILVMELASQLDRLGMQLQLRWLPRNQNEEADDLTNERFSDFREENRVHVDFEKLEFLVMGDLMKLAGELDEELKLYRTSKEAKLGKLIKEQGEKGRKAKKGEMRWKDPW